MQYTTKYHKGSACSNQPLPPCNLPYLQPVPSPSNKLGIDDGVKEGSISPDVVNLGDSKLTLSAFSALSLPIIATLRLTHLFPNHYDGKPLEEGRWLNDRLSNGTQEHLQRQFFITKSLQYTLLGQLKGWNKMESNGVQIIHENNSY